MESLLEDPGLIQAEIDRRREAAKKADPLTNPFSITPATRLAI